MVDFATALAKLEERPETFDLAEEQQIVEMLYGTNIRNSIKNLFNSSYQGEVLQKMDISGLLIKCGEYSMNGMFVSDVEFSDINEESFIAQAMNSSGNLLLALYNSLIVKYGKSPYPIENLAEIIAFYSNAADFENIFQTENVFKPMCVVDEFLSKFSDASYIFPLWSTRFDSIYSIFKSVQKDQPVIVRVNGNVYYNELKKKSEHFVVLIGFRNGYAITIDSSMNDFINFCPIGNFLYALVADKTSTCAWDLSLLPDTL